LNERFSLHPGHLLEFLGAQAGVISPLFFIGLLVILCRPSLLRKPQPATAYALALTLPLLGFYLVLSLHYHEPPNWTAAGYIGGLVLLAVKWLDLGAVQRWARSAAVAGIIFAAIETSLLLETRWLHLPHKLDPLDRARGSRQLAASVAQVQEQTGAQFVIANNYMTAALLSFYLPGQPKTFVLITDHPMDQLEVWPTYEEEHPSGDALYVSKRDKLSAPFRGSFSDVRRLKKIDVVDAGRTVGHYELYLCRCGHSGSGL
jgi:hypothetical protein